MFWLKIDQYFRRFVKTHINFFADQLNTYPNNNSLLPPLHSGFGLGYITTLNDITDGIIQSTDLYRFLLFLLEFNKALYTKNHKISFCPEAHNNLIN